MDKNLINQLLALPGEELHLKKGDFLFHEGDMRCIRISVR